jgi:hypothetical protein
MTFREYAAAQALKGLLAARVMDDSGDAALLFYGRDRGLAWNNGFIPQRLADLAVDAADSLLERLGRDAVDYGAAPEGGADASGCDLAAEAGGEEDDGA